MNTIALYFSRIAGLKTFIIATLIYVAFGGYVMPQGAKKIASLAGKPVEILDLQFSYTTTRAADILSAYTPEAIAFGVWFSWVADTVYPLVYGFLFIIILAWIYNNVPQHLAAYRYIHLLPITTVVIDFVENFFIRRVMLSYPNLQDSAVATASFFTTVKWLSVAALAAAAVFGLLLLLRKRMG